MSANGQAPDQPGQVPYNLEAEAAVLGAMLLAGRGNRADDGLALTREEDYYRPEHRAVYRAVAELRAGGGAVDPVLVLDRLKRAGTLADLGGAPFLFGLVEALPTSAHLDTYAAIVREASARRQLIDAAHQLRQFAVEGAGDAARLADLAEERVREFAERARGGAAGLPVQPAGTKPAGERPAVLIGELLVQGELAVFGAARGQAKSWWGMELLRALATGPAYGLFMGRFPVRRAARVLYCHGELDKWQAYDRWQRLDGSEPVLPGAVETFEPWRLRVVTRRLHSGQSSTEFIDAILDGRLEATIREHAIEVLVIDPWAVYYTGRENSNDEAEAALSLLGALQRRYGLTVVVLHHFGKANDVRDPEDLWRGASRLPDWAATRITLLPYYTAKEAQAQGMTRQQARRYAKAAFLRRGGVTPDDLAVVWNPASGQWERWHSPEDAAAEQRIQLNPVDVAAACPAEGWPSILAAAAGLKVGQTKAAELLQQAVAAGELEEFKAARNGRGFRVPEHRSTSRATSRAAVAHLPPGAPNPGQEQETLDLPRPDLPHPPV